MVPPEYVGGIDNAGCRFWGRVAHFYWMNDLLTLALDDVVYESLSGQGRAAGRPSIVSIVIDLDPARLQPFDMGMGFGATFDGLSIPRINLKNYACSQRVPFQTSSTAGSFCTYLLSEGADGDWVESIVASGQEAVVWRIDLNGPVDIASARDLLSALLLLMTLGLKRHGPALRRVRFLLQTDSDPLDAAVFSSQSLIHALDASRVSASPWKPILPPSFTMLGGQTGMAAWTAYMSEVPHVVDVFLRVIRRGDSDQMASIVDLATAWEHIMKAGDSSAWYEPGRPNGIPYRVARLLEDLSNSAGTSGVDAQARDALIKLAWETNNATKHGSLHPTASPRHALSRMQHDDQRIAVDFMLSALLVMCLERSGLRDAAVAAMANCDVSSDPEAPPGMNGRLGLVQRAYGGATNYLGALAR